MGAADEEDWHFAEHVGVGVFRVCAAWRDV